MMGYKLQYIYGRLDLQEFEGKFNFFIRGNLKIKRAVEDKGRLVIYSTCGIFILEYAHCMCKKIPIKNAMIYMVKIVYKNDKMSL